MNPGGDLRQLLASKVSVQAVQASAGRTTPASHGGLLHKPQNLKP